MNIGNLEVFGVIYKIQNKINKKAYIGQTTRERGFNDRYDSKGKGIERVYNYYCYNKKSNRYYNKHLFRSINKYGFNAFDITYILDVAFSQEELNIKEKVWILVYDSFKNGYNNTIGGDGVRGIKGGLNVLSKSVMQFSKEGKYIKTWNSVSEASSYYNTDTSNITSCCKHKTYIAVGYIWIYKEDYLKNPIVKPYKSNRNITNKIPIIQLSLQGEFIKEWESMYDAMNILHIDNRLISECCNKKTKSAGNYMWMKKEDYLKNKKIKPYKKKNKHKNVVKLDLRGNLIKEYISVRQAALSIKSSTKNIESNIIACCKGKQKSAYNYRWMYLKDYNYNINNIKPIERLHDSKPKVVIQLDLQNNFIHKWNSLLEADKNTHINFKNISACCRHKRKTTHGYKWIFAEEYYKEININ